MRFRISLATVLLVAAGSAQAMSVTWSFQDAILNDGTSLTGSFKFDASVGGAAGFSNFDLSTEDGSGLIAQTYNGVTPLAGSIGFLAIAGGQGLGTAFGNLLTNAGGKIGIDFGSELGTAGPRFIESGGVESGGVGGAAVSLAEPVALTIFLIGLAALLAMRRKAIL